MDQDTKDQGLTNNDGKSLEPSDLEGDIGQDPSMTDTDLEDAKVTEPQIPDQDDRGVPAQNVLSEMLRKVDKLTEELGVLRTGQNTMQGFQQQATIPVQAQPQQQVPQKVPRTPSDVANMVEKETREKFGEALQAGNADFWEVNRFQHERFAELNAVMTQNLSRISSERIISENRIQGLYDDLKNPQSQLSQATFREIQRRAYIRGMDPQDYYAQDPNVVESVAPIVAQQLGITPKFNNKVKIKPLSKGSLPPQNFDGRATVNDDKIVPTAEEIAFSKRFGVKAETYANMKKVSPGATEFTDDGESLLS